MRKLLLAYGVLFAVIGILVLGGTPRSSLTLQGARADSIRGSISVLDRGGPPLLGSDGGQPVAPEAGDDPGVILYLSLLGHAVGSSDPLQLLKWTFVGAFALLFAVYPILWFELLSSAAAALISPLLLLFGFRFLAVHDIYWVAAWCILLCIPLIALVHRRWGSKSLIYLSGVMLIASLASSIRASAGLPVVLAAAISTVWNVRGWLRRVTWLAVLAVAYLAISGPSMTAVRHYRDESVGIDYSKEFSKGHTFWHPAYLGLGYLPNKFGIKLVDSAGLRAAQRVNPKVEYLSPQYERILRHLYLRILKKDPGYVIRVYVDKASVVLADAFRRFWLGILLLPAMLVAPTRLRREARLFAVLLVPAVLLGAVSPILWLPESSYETGWLGAWGLLCLLAILWLVALISRAAVTSGVLDSLSEGARLPRFGRYPRPPGTPAPRRARSWLLLARQRPIRWSLAAVLVVCGLGFGLTRAADSVRAESASQLALADTSDLVRLPVRHGPTLERWAFARCCRRARPRGVWRHRAGRRAFGRLRPPGPRCEEAAVRRREQLLRRPATLEHELR